MTITKQQFADLLDGLGGARTSSGAYEGLPPVTAFGAFVKAVADEIRENPTETCETPTKMTASMHTLVRRMATGVSGCPERVLVNSAPEFSALRMAWRERSAAHAGEGRWKGPGYYRLSGFYDGPRSVATVEFDSPHPQGELPGLR